MEENCQKFGKKLIKNMLNKMQILVYSIFILSILLFVSVLMMPKGCDCEYCPFHNEDYTSRSIKRVSQTGKLSSKQQSGRFKKSRVVT